MRITVVGWGNVGRTLGEGWRSAGHDVTVASRDPGSASADSLRAAGWEVATVAAAAPTADVVVLATPGTAVVETVRGAADALANRLVIDTTNDLRADASALHHLPELAEAVPTARLIRAFTTMAWENFAEPELDGRRLDQYYVADDGEDAIANTLISDLHLTPVRLGGLAEVEHLDSITRVWFHLVWRLGYPRRTALTITGEPHG